MKKIILSTLAIVALAATLALNASPERDRGLGFSDSMSGCNMSQSYCSKQCHKHCAADRENCGKCCAKKTECMKDSSKMDAACAEHCADKASAPAMEMPAPASEAPAAK